MRQLRLPLILCVCTAWIIAFFIGVVANVAEQVQGDVQHCLTRGGTWTVSGYCVRVGESAPRRQWPFMGP
jgi:hypothetical protein